MIPPPRGSSSQRRSLTLVTASVLAVLVVVNAGTRPAFAQAGPPQVSAPAFPAAADALLARGDLEGAERLANAEGAPPVAAALVRARIALLRGRYEEARTSLEPLASAEPLGDAALELGLLHLRLGHRDEAAATLEPFVEARTEAERVEDLVRAGRAARALGRFRIANALFRDAASLAPDDPSVNVAWGDLLLEKYNLPEAVKSFEAALQASPDHAAAHLGLARALADENPAIAAARARQALAINPTTADAHVVLARLALDERRRDSAGDEVAAALAINPRHFEARALRAAIAYLEDRREAFDAEVRAILQLNPSYGDAYRIAAAEVAAAYRFDEAAALARRALEVDPDNARARAELGLHLLRTGDETEARMQLDLAFAADPFDVVTFNLLNLLDTLQGFETVTEGDLVVRLPPDEAPLMRTPVLALARDALAALSDRYDFTPRGPLLVEMFSSHDDFAVRNVGLPGMQGAVGACFGRVVTLDSPRARPRPGTMNWAATLWHELAHVVTLQMSGQRVPRWLSEGLSVLEERRARGHWGGEGTFGFLQAYSRGELLPLASLNRGFSDPAAIALSYHQASLLAEHLEERFGQAAIGDMLRAYGEGLDDEQVFARVLRVDTAALQASFDAYLDRRFGAARDALRVPGDLGAEIEEPARPLAERLAQEHPSVFAIQVALGRARATDGDLPGAIEAFERADRLVPGLTGEESPGMWIARLREREGNVAAAMEALERVLAVDHTGLDAAQMLARLAAGAPDAQRLRTAYARMVEVSPLEAEPYAELGHLALHDGDAAAAAEHYRRALMAGPGDVVAVRTGLAESLLLTGSPREAKHEVIAALEVAPRYERAQELLLRIVDGNGGRHP